jgi:hypothetical protein
MEDSGTASIAASPHDRLSQLPRKSACPRDKEISGFATTTAPQDGLTLLHFRKLDQSKNIVLSSLAATSAPRDARRVPQWQQYILFSLACEAHSSPRQGLLPMIGSPSLLVIREAPPPVHLCSAEIRVSAAGRTWRPGTPSLCPARTPYQRVSLSGTVMNFQTVWRCDFCGRLTRAARKS